VRPFRFCTALGLNVHLRRCRSAPAKHVMPQVIPISLKYIYTYAHFVEWTNFWNVSSLLNVIFFFKVCLSTTLSLVKLHLGRTRKPTQSNKVLREISFLCQQTSISGLSNY